MRAWYGPIHNRIEISVCHDNANRSRCYWSSTVTAVRLVYWQLPNTRANYYVHYIFIYIYNLFIHLNARLCHTEVVKSHQTPILPYQASSICILVVLTTCIWISHCFQVFFALFVTNYTNYHSDLQRLLQSIINPYSSFTKSKTL